MTKTFRDNCDMDISDVVETVTSETDTETWKFETETSHFSGGN